MNGFSFFFIVILVQAVVAAVVIYVLKRQLDRELVEAALEKLQGFHWEGITGDIVIKSQPSLKPQSQAHAQAIVHRKLPQARIVFVTDSSIWGGIVIELSGQTLDFSLVNRLKNFWT